MRQQRDHRLLRAGLAARMRSHAHHRGSLGRMRFQPLLRGAQLLHLGLRHLHLGCGHVAIRLCVAQLLRGFVHAVCIRRAFSRCRLPTRQHGLELWNARRAGLLARLRQPPLRFGHRQIGTRRIVRHAQQQLAALHTLPFLHKQLLHRALDGGRELQQPAFHLNLAARHGHGALLRLRLGLRGSGRMGGGCGQGGCLICTRRRATCQHGGCHGQAYGRQA
ncbi:hypothetical protein SDC9_99652 [bioreactor metagenome]|uniref:Uncharacterized protein n=1 Tax=bioreactor metagenome TaxID=1076179 RepID=A0A645AJH6_9ZZZZ